MILPTLGFFFTVTSDSIATWMTQYLNKPEVRVAVDIGSTHDLFARRIIPNATLLALKTRSPAWR
jgi:polar amino acid transport system substrate-binding protein